ncbi:hypothetical protein VTI28DRAFT_3313 [Corynascus sepedonium]
MRSRLSQVYCCKISLGERGCVEAVEPQPRARGEEGSTLAAKPTLGIAYIPALLLHFKDKTPKVHSFELDEFCWSHVRVPIFWPTSFFDSYFATALIHSQLSFPAIGCAPSKVQCPDKHFPPTPTARLRSQHPA